MILYQSNNPKKVLKETKGQNWKVSRGSYGTLGQKFSKLNYTYMRKLNAVWKKYFSFLQLDDAN